jgi:hypothetical protein
MSVLCPECKGVTPMHQYHGMNQYGPCWKCNGTGQVKSKREEEREWKVRDKIQREGDRKAPLVTIRVQLPMLRRGLDNAGEMGFLSSRDVIRFWSDTSKRNRETFSIEH